jgi:hypothetical protein
MKPFYIYKHTNGTYHRKPAIVVESDPQYFDSPFVEYWWKIDPSDPDTVNAFLDDNYDVDDEELERCIGAV